MLPNYRKDSHWLSQVYKDYDILDYRNIMELDNFLPNDFIENTNIGWIRSFDDEGRTVNVSKDDKQNLKSIDKLYEYKILRDVVDLFGLIYSKKFVRSEET